MKIDELIPPTLLADALEQGYVRKQVHPALPLVILNYTERAAYAGVWNQATLTCRGLIYDASTSEVVARPFPKFFNYGQPGAPELDLDAQAVVTEKMDGSLGILYPLGEPLGGYAVATRGSFTSDQALHATETLRTMYADWCARPTENVGPLDGWTYLFEIIYPENRIVCDYGPLDDLVLLAVLSNETGCQGSPRFWPGPRVHEHPYGSLAEALAAEPRPGKEGLVVYLPERDVRVKIKQADYVALHRIVTGLNKRTVWEHLGAGKPIEDLIAPLPDEFRPWVEDVVAELSATVAAQAGEVERLYAEIVNELTDGGPWVCEECGGGLVWVTEGCEGGPCPGWACSTFGCDSQWRVVQPSRRDFAELATKSLWSWALFQRLDGKDYGPRLWHLNRPDPETPAGRVYTEDVA